MKTKDATASDRFYCRAFGALLLVVLLAVAFIRIRFLQVPLERDEGEYAYGGQLILSAIDPYSLCYTMKLPGTAALYALFMALFGQTTTAIHLGLLAVNACTGAALYFLARRLWGAWPGAVAAACFLLFSVLKSVLGLAGHATQFVIFPAMWGLVLLLRGIASGRLRWFMASGLLLGLAFVLKQQGAFFALFALAYLLWSLRKQGVRTLILTSAAFLSGAVLPFALTCLAIYMRGDFQNFWFWVVDYAHAYAAEASPAEALLNLTSTLSAVLGEGWPLWLIAAFGLLSTLWDNEVRKHGVFIIGLLVFSCAALSVGFYFRKHYFILILPVLSLLSAAGIVAMVNLHKGSAARAPLIPFILFCAAVLGCILPRAGFYFADDPVQAFASLYLTNPFIEAPVIGVYLKDHSVAGDRIAVIGSEPEIYFYSQRRSATGYIYMYPLMELQPFAAKMQKQMIAEIESSKPKFLVFISSGLSWLARAESDKTIVEWAQSYAHEHYRKIGVTDIRNGIIEYHWDDAEHYEPQSQFAVFVFERKL